MVSLFAGLAGDYGVDVSLLCSFDSELAKDPSIAALTPHTAFDDPTKPEGSPLRESIELRLLVFYDD